MIILTMTIGKMMMTIMKTKIMTERRNKNPRKKKNLRRNNKRRPKKKMMLLHKDATR